MAHSRLRTPAVRVVPGQDCTNIFEWGRVPRDCLLKAPGTGVTVRTSGGRRDVSNGVGEKTAMFKRLLVFQLVKILTPLYGTRRFITAYTTSQSPFRARSIRPTVEDVDHVTWCNIVTLRNL
jgi:hypothetical protein